jgi:glutathione peroxidase
VHSIHQFKVEGIEGQEIDLADFKGKKILIVNVASECGFTPQYQQLQELYDEFNDQLTVIGFPANNFGGQEPGSDETIKAFCTQRYGVTFPLASKIDIHTHPVYHWLTHQEQNGVANHEVRWNFHKFLIDENGHLLHAFPSSVSPLDDAILSLMDH